MKNWEKAVLAIIVIYLVCAAIGGSLYPTQWSFLQTAPSTQAPAGVAGMFDVDTKGYNSLDISTVLAENTNYDCYWYANRGGWLLLGKGATTIELTDVDGGYVYAVVKEHGSASLYVDWSETKAKNPRVEAVTYEDVDNDGYKEFVFKFNMANIPKPASGNPKVYFYPYFLAYEKPSINTPADITGIGTAKLTKYVEWYLYFANVKKAFAITKIEITINTTDTTKVEIKSIAVPGMGSITGDMIGAPVKGVNTLTYSYTVGSNLYNALYMPYPANTLNKFYFTNQLDLSLSVGDVLSYTMTVYGLTDAGSLTTVTDTVLLKTS